MGILARLVQKLDDNVSTALDRHLEIAIPKQRSTSPDGVPSCCDCCRERFAPAACPLVPHSRPCPDCQDDAA